MQISTGGRPKTVLFSPTKGRGRINTPQSLSHKNLLDVQTELNLSDRKTLTLAKSVRKSAGSKSVESHLKRALEDRGKILMPFFDRFQCLLQIKEKEQKDPTYVEKQIIFVKNLKEFIKFISDKRHFEETYMKVGIDGGGEFLKMCINMTSGECSKLQGDNKFLNSGVKKLFIIGITKISHEAYENIKELFRLTNLNSISYTLACDLKLANIVAGLQNHSSKHPCTWCDSTEPYDKVGKLRTIGKISEYAEAYKSAGYPLKKPQRYYSCIHTPLFEKSPETEILDLIPSPELHLMLGVTNLIFNELNAKWGNDEAYKWAEECLHIKRIGYRGGSFEGNQCKYILEKANLLLDKVPKDLEKFVTYLERFNSVRLSCFVVNLRDDYLTSIKLFRQSYTDLKLHVTPKMHAIYDHVPQFCAKTKSGLGKYSEQASEAVHHDFSLTWQNYKVLESHPNFGEKLLNALVKYNSMHI